ncbi:MAG TPA: fibronectin type III domain-containing protein [Solirubrobacterales bacterium]
MQSSHGIAVDYESGAVYVTEQEPTPGGSSLLLAKFHADGTPWEFGASGSNTLPVHSLGSSVAVDNSGGAGQGNVYVGEAQRTIPGQSSQPHLNAFDENGTLLWSLAVAETLYDVAVDQDGHVWTFSYGGTHAREYDPSSDPPVELSSYEVGSVFYGDVDASENLFLGQPLELTKWVGGAFDSTIDSDAREVSVDQSSVSGHIFTSVFTSFSEFDTSGTEVDTYGSELLSGVEVPAEQRAIAYNPTLDRLYMLVGRASTQESDFPLAAPTVLVFGSRRTGTVPDVGIDAPSSVGVSSASFSGTVNPQGSASEWYFEWKLEGSPWVAAESSPPQALAGDTADHAVGFATNTLRGNTNYEVRLVAVNTANDLRSFSSAESFTTATAAAPPTVTIDPAADVTTDSAKISGTVDPEGDTAGWRLQVSTDPTCGGGFEDRPLERIGVGTTSAEPVEETLTGLLPSEHYCVRIAATNSAGTTTSSVVEFTTDPIAAVGLEAIGVAPRSDTSARLNARVNPNGEDLTYRFQYSSDGGGSWQTLPDLVEESGARSEIVISQKVSGLQPDTTYLFKVSAENPVGGSQSEERSFTTRTTEEVTLPPRGYELVNTPDKGNQHVQMARSAMRQGSISADGGKVLWEVLGGAPGGFNGAGNLFLAERTASGWKSRSLAPPASEQVGEGTHRYRLAIRSEDMSRFVLTAAKSSIEGLSTPPDTTYVRLDAHQNQDVLGRFDDDLVIHGVDATADGSHVVTVNAKITGQVVDVGSGTPEVLSIMPDGAEATCGVDSGSGFGGTGSFLGGGMTNQWRAGYHMIATTDASIVYFQTHPNGSDCSGSRSLYVRDRTSEETTLIASPDELTDGEPEFIRATPNGQHAYFTSKASLDPSDGGLDWDIYRWDHASKESTCLTCMVPAANVFGNVLISDDFSRIYFGSLSTLIPGKGGLYVLSEGELRPGPSAPADLRTALTTPDGGVLVFSAEASPAVTSDETAPVCKSNSEETPTGCVQLYRFELEEESVECLSCDRNGLTTWKGFFNSFGSPFPNVDMSADGSVVALATREALLPNDINGRTDVYEWRNGSLRLITDGETEFADFGLAVPTVRGVSADGGTILYAAPEPGLTGYERDGLGNLYAARVGGGFPRPATPVHCSEDACQGPLAPPPPERAPGSSSSQSRGNLTSKGKKRRVCRKRSTRGKGQRVRKQAHCSKRKGRGSHRRGPASNRNGRGSK